MVLKPSLMLCAVLFVGSAGLARAQEPSCAGPGAAFGITAYECTRCGIFNLKDGRVRQVFHVEPRVLEVAPGSPFEVGDIILGFPKKPITTPEGAESFTYPRRAVYFVEIRRNGKPAILTVRTTVDCSAPAEGSRTTGTTVPPPMLTVTKDSGEVQAGRLGFALGCLPSCTRTISADGQQTWKFDGAPPVVAVRPNTPAAAAGLQVGDVVVEVDGKSLEGPDGYLRLAGAQTATATTMTFTVLRDGQRRTITITPEPRR